MKKLLSIIVLCIMLVGCDGKIISSAPAIPNDMPIAEVKCSTMGGLVSLEKNEGMLVYYFEAICKDGSAVVYTEEINK